MKFHFETGVCDRDEERFVPDIDEGDRLLPLLSEKGDELAVTRLLFQISELRLVGKMRQDHGRVFHRVIIASVCCMVLAGCGHKTDPVYVPDEPQTQETQAAN